MATCKDRLKSDGWNVSENGLQLLGVSNKEDYREIVGDALNLELKEINEACLAAQISKHRISQLVLQIQKIGNVSAPKANEDSLTAPRMLKLTLTDGHSTCQAIEVENLPDISLHKTAPGTKLLVNGAQVQGGYVMLNKSCCRNLGGRVSALYEKWELSKQMLKQSRSNPTDGPPAWVNFGKKIVKAGELADFKSLADKSKNASKGTSEFNAQRQDAIAEAATGAVKKIFSKGNQENVVNKYNIQNDRKNAEPPRRNTRQNRRGRKDEELEDKISTKPSDKVSLFQFLEDKLPEQPCAVANPNLNDVLRSNQNKHETIDFQRPIKGKNQDINRSKNEFEMAPSKGFTMNMPRHNGDGPPSHGSRTKYGQDFKDTRNSSHNNYNIESKSNNYETQHKNDNNSLKKNPPSKATSSETTSSVDALINDTSRLNVNQQFAARSLQLHLNLNKVGDFKANQSFYNRDNYGNPFGSKYNTSDKKQTTNNFRRLKSYQPYQMAAIDDFGGPKLSAHTNANQKRNDSQHNNFGRTNSSNIPQNMKPNFTPQQNGSNNSIGCTPTWKVGDQCMAKYWEDGQFYIAIVTAVTEKTCVVQFNEYGNIEEVLNEDCIIIVDHTHAVKPKNQRNRYFNRSKQ